MCGIGKKAVERSAAAAEFEFEFEMEMEASYRKMAAINFEKRLLLPITSSKVNLMKQIHHPAAKYDRT